MAKVVKKVLGKAAPNKVLSKPRPNAGGAGLSGLQKFFDHSESWSGGGYKPEDGIHECTIENAVIGTSRNGRAQIDWTFLMTGEGVEGKQFHDYQGLETQENVNFVRGRIETLGIEWPDDPNSLGNALEQACGLAVRIQVRTNQEFTNVTVIDVLEAGSTAGDDAGTTEEAPEAGDSYTKADIKKLAKAESSELEDIARSLEIDPDEYDWDELADAVIGMLDL
jgi:hypothetical protein